VPGIGSTGTFSRTCPFGVQAHAADDRAVRPCDDGLRREKSSSSLERSTVSRRRCSDAGVRDHGPDHVSFGYSP
jgi:hypothetical protein